MKQYKVIHGEAEGYSKPPYHEHDHSIEAQLTRASAEGWVLVHTSSYAPVSTDSHTRPLFRCLLEREVPAPAPARCPINHWCVAGNGHRGHCYDVDGDKSP